MTEHLTDTALSQYLDDALTPGQRAALEQHVQTCDSCRRLMSGVNQLVSEVSSFSTGGPSHTDAPALPLIRGTEVGRYVLLDRLGGGGMGVVYAAFDPALDRKVALKFIRESLRTPDAQRIADREAKTMARLQHPNVVSVFDVGLLANRTFLAMEYVEGTTLQGWLAQAKRSSREVGAVFLAAARGLEAVHAAGLVHGDFKPANVLISDTGHIKVTDFGLARDAAHLDAQLGGAGTIAFMAPEQLAGGHADARSDQFAFCTALTTALTEVPNDRLRRQLASLATRGLDADPSRRYASMSHLSSAIERAIYVPRRSVTMLAFAVLAALGIALGLTLSHAPCQSEPLLADTWNEAHRGAVLAAFARAPVPYAAAVGQTVVHELDGYATRWQTQRTDACLATQVRHEQSAELLDLRVDCYERRRLELAALVKELEHAEGPLVSRAADMAGSLEPVERCQDRRALLELAPVPHDAPARAALEAAWQHLALAKAARSAGRFKDPTVAERALASAEQTRQPYLEAEALLLLADFQDSTKASQTAWRALATAEAGHHDVAKAQALFKILEGEVTRPQNQQRTDELIAFARAAVARAGSPSLLSFLLNRSIGAALRKTGRLAEAIDVLRGAVELGERADDLPPHLLANGYNTLGVALLTAGRSDEALPVLLHAREALTRSLGPDHPLVAQTEVNLGSILSTLTRFDEAEAMLAHAEKVYARSLASPNAFMPGVLINRAEVELLRGKLPHALELSRRALALYVEASGATSANAALGHTQTGQALFRLSRYAEALTELNEARRIYVQLKGPDANELTEVLQLLGMTQAALHQPREAMATLVEAIRVGALARGADTCEAARARYPLAKVLVTLGQFSSVAEQLEKTVHACEHSGDGADVTALARFDLAAEHWRREHHPSALTEARLVLGNYAALPSADPVRVSEMRAWLSQHQ